nr:HT motif family protein [Oriental turtle dovepox virus]
MYFLKKYNVFTLFFYLWILVTSLVSGYLNHVWIKYGSESYHDDAMIFSLSAKYDMFRTFHINTDHYTTTT